MVTAPRTSSYTRIDSLSLNRVTRLENDPYDWDDQVDYEGLSGLDRAVSGDIRDGLLTRRGAQQEVELGESLGSIYHGRMNLTADNVRVRSTRFSRTWLSARYVYQGLVGSTPPSGSIQVNPIDSDSLLVNERACPRLAKVVADSQRGPEFHELGQEMISLEQIARKDLGLRLQLGSQRNKNLLGHYTPDGSQFFEYADQFFTRSCYAGESSLVGEQFCRVSRLAWEMTRAAFSRNPLHSRLRLGHLVQELYLAQLEAITDETAFSRFRVIAAHDTTLAHLNTALETLQFKWPPYASNFLLETWKGPTTGSTSGPFVRVIYNGQLVRFPWAAPRIDGLVPFDTFYAFIRHLLPTEHECSV